MHPERSPRRRRLLIPALLALAVATLGAAPWLLATFASSWALNALGESLNGTVECETLALSWSGPIRLEAGSFTPTGDSEALASWESITIEGSWWSVLTNATADSPMTITAPRLDLVRPEEGESNLARFLRATDRTLDALIRIEKGEIHIEDKGLGQTAKIALQTLEWDPSSSRLRTQGDLVPHEGTGTFKLDVPIDSLDPFSQRWDIELTANECQIRSLRTFLSVLTPYEDLIGLWNADIAFRSDGLGLLEMEGRIRGRHLRLEGGPFTRRAFKEAQVEWTGQASLDVPKRLVVCEPFSLSASPFTLDARGRLHQRDEEFEGRLDLAFNGDLSKFATVIRGALPKDRDFGGDCKANLNLNAKGPSLQFDWQCEGNNASWFEPETEHAAQLSFLRCQATGDCGPELRWITLDQVHLETEFLVLKGSASLDDLTRLESSFNVEFMLGQIDGWSRFFNPDLEANGTATAQGRVSSTEDHWALIIDGKGEEITYESEAWPPLSFSTMTYGVDARWPRKALRKEIPIGAFRVETPSFDLELENTRTATGVESALVSQLHLSGLPEALPTLWPGECRASGTLKAQSGSRVVWRNEETSLWPEIDSTWSGDGLRVGQDQSAIESLRLRRGDSGTELAVEQAELNGGVWNWGLHLEKEGGFKHHAAWAGGTLTHCFPPLFGVGIPFQAHLAERPLVHSYALDLRGIGNLRSFMERHWTESKGRAHLQIGPLSLDESHLLEDIAPGELLAQGYHAEFNLNETGIDFRSAVLRTSSFDVSLGGRATLNGHLHNLGIIRYKENSGSPGSERRFRLEGPRKSPRLTWDDS